MRPFLRSGHRAPVIACIVMWMASPGSAAETVSSVSAPRPALTDAVPQAQRATPLDLSTATVRDAARSSASASNDDMENPAPAAPSKAFKEWLPPCRPLLAVARLVALVAVCATDHCGNSGSALDDTLPVRPAPMPRTAPTCASNGVKLW